MGPKLFTLSTGNELIIVGAILLIYIGIRVASAMTSRGKSRSVVPLGSQRNYSLAGGAICPKCHRPFHLDFMAIKIGFGVKFTRCENCGKWSVVRRASMEELRAAERAELAETQAGQQVHEKSAEAKLDEMLDESRFTDKK